MLRRKKATGLDHDRNSHDPASLSSFLRREAINSVKSYEVLMKQIFSAYAENVIKSKKYC